MTKIAVGNISRTVYARLDAQADVLLSLYEVIKSERIHTGLILDLTGALEKATIQHYNELGPVDSKVAVVDLVGPMEVSGSGIIGRCVGTGGVGGYVDGEPYVHCHITVTNAVHTMMGHLMPGCIVRSPHTMSHFTVVIAEVAGLELEQTSGGPGEENGGRGVWTKEDGYTWHELREV